MNFLQRLFDRLVGMSNLDSEFSGKAYRLADGHGCELREHGKFKAVGFAAPLVL